MKSKEELEKEPMPYDNETPKKCPKCGNWFLSYPALSRRDNSTYICPDCGVKEAMEDYMSSMKKEGLEEATAKALLEDPENETLTKPLTESVDWDYYDKFEDLINKYMPDQGEGETLASQIVTAVNKLVYKWYNDGDVYDNVNSGLQGWANDLSSYANWLYKYAPGDVPQILKNIYGMGEESDYETLLKELADNLLDENLLDSLEKSKQGSIYDCDGPFEFKEYDEEDEDEWDEDDYEEEDEEDLEESKEVVKKELNKDELLNKLEDYVLNQYTIFNDKLYDDFGDIQMNDKDKSKRSIYIYYDIEEDKISVTVGAAGARTFVDTIDEVAQFINAEIAKVNAQDEEIKKSVEESKEAKTYDDIEFKVCTNIDDKYENRIWTNISAEEAKEILGKDLFNKTLKRCRVKGDAISCNSDFSKYVSFDKKLEESLDKEYDEYLKKMDKKYKTFCKNMELDEKDPDDALFALDELEGQFGDEDGEYQELREFIHNELLESKKITENTEYWEKTIGFNPYDVNYEKNKKALDIINKFKKAGKLDSLFDYLASGITEPFTTESSYLAYVADTDISDYEIYNGKLEEGTKQKRISHYNEFDNGHILHSWNEMSNEEAEEKAKQASIDNPNDVYYVQYDDVMNPCSELRWFRGKQYTIDTIDKEGSEYYDYRNSKTLKEEGKKITDQDIEKAIRAQIKDNNGIFTDDSKYDVIEKLTGIKDIEMMPQGLYERVSEIYENNFNK